MVLESALFLFHIAEPPDESIDETACRGVF